MNPLSASTQADKQRSLFMKGERARARIRVYRTKTNAVQELDDRRSISILDKDIKRRCRDFLVNEELKGTRAGYEYCIDRLQTSESGNFLVVIEYLAQEAC